MALRDSGVQSSGVWQAVKGALQMFQRINKAEGQNEDVNPAPIDEYESSYSEEDVLELVGFWKRDYRVYYEAGIEASQQTSFEYWIGKQQADEADQLINGSTPLVDNKIFEAVETFIPIATRANPDPLVQADPSEIGQKIAGDVKQALVREADRQKLRKVLKSALRHWIIYRLGVIKVGYDPVLGEIVTEAINPKRMIFDRDGKWDESGRFVGEYIGEKKQATASKLIKMFPKKSKDILEKGGSKKGTKLEYTEWWYRDTDVFYTLDDLVLGKYRNPHWNYDIEGMPEETHPETGEVMAPAQEAQEGKNHFKKPWSPYTGLCIFSTGIQPHDETSLILQNIGIQDMINRRWRQIDKNVEGMNNGMVVNKSFTAEQASQAAAALRRGTAIRALTDDVSKAVMRLPAPALPDDVYNTLKDGRQELQNIFGTAGSTPQGIQGQDQVRGKILVNQLDTSRIGGGVTEYLEQVADTVYNWWVQLMFVHWTDTHYITAAGAVDGAELVKLKNTDFALLTTLDVTVKEGSLIPKDPLTQRNEAIDLWSANAIDPINFYKKLDYADPVNSAKMLLMWQMVQKGLIPPQAYIPDFQIPPEAQQQMQAPQGAPNLPEQGVGDSDINTIAGKGDNTGAAPAAPDSNEAVSSQSKQLLDSVPVK